MDTVGSVFVQGGGGEGEGDGDGEGEGEGRGCGHLFYRGRLCSHPDTHGHTDQCRCHMSPQYTPHKLPDSSLHILLRHNLQNKMSQFTSGFHTIEKMTELSIYFK